MKRVRLGLAAALCVSISGVAWAGELGQAAPALKISEWVKGKAVDLKEGKGKNVYVVEFWATWCPPCRASIPHLTELQAKYKDKNVVFIGVSDEEVGTVKKFVDKMGDKMAYTVAIDDEKETSKGYMQEFGIRGIPHAFIVDRDGKIAWHTHPMDPSFEKALDKVVSGKFDKAAADAMDKEMKAAQEAERKAVKAMEEYITAAQGGTSKAKLREQGEQVVKGAGDNAQLLNAFAWTILTNEQIKDRDIELALTAAKVANDATHGKDAAILDTYARALFDSGKVKEAIVQQKKAVEMCKDEQLMEDLKEALAKYEKAGKEG